MEQVKGIGGLFFRARVLLCLRSGTAIIRAWRSFLRITRRLPGSRRPGQRSRAFPGNHDIFRDAGKVWMINFRVGNLDAMAAQFRSAGISVEIDAQVYPNGRFARLYDPEGNPIELWEPAGRRDAAR